MTATRYVHNAAIAFGAACILLGLAAFSSTAWAKAGYVHEYSGTVSMQSVSAKAAPAKVGATFESNTIFHTGADGRLVLKFADGQVAAMGVDSALRVGEYRYVAGDLRQNTTAVELMRGQMRFVTGLIGATNREGVRITAGNSMLRVQSRGGADFVVRVNPDPEEVGAAVVALGEISVRTPYGPIHKIEASQYVPWQPGRKPPLPMPLAAAPAVIQAGVADLWTTVVPVNTPVEVAATARMAAVAAAAGQAQTIARVDARHVGYVDSISNTVSVKTPSGKTAGAKVGDTFNAGTSFDTGADGRVALKFADGQLVVLGPGSVLGVDQYHFDPNDIKASRTALDLVNGSMRYVSGTIHAENREGVSISVGASLVDILNTGLADFTVVVNTRRQEVGIATVAAGEIGVHTPYGPISKIEAGQAAPWQPGQTPLLPQAFAAAAENFRAAVAALAKTALPENTPVIVASAAQAAAAADAASLAEAAASAEPGNAQLRAAAQAAAEQANAATQAAITAAQAVTATLFASTLAALPATAAGPAQAQVPPAAPALPPPAVPITPSVTPGGGGKCIGSKC